LQTEQRVEPQVTESEKERIARLETQIIHLADSIRSMSAKVDDLHTLLNQAKGARWALLGMAGIAGFFGSKAGAWLWTLPK
jgi:septal ring factor EnvC (AmiA/AmiB activator)